MGESQVHLSSVRQFAKSYNLCSLLFKIKKKNGTRRKKIPASLSVQGDQQIVERLASATHLSDNSLICIRNKLTKEEV